MIAVKLLDNGNYTSGQNVVWPAKFYIPLPQKHASPYNSTMAKLTLHACSVMSLRVLHRDKDNMPSQIIKATHMHHGCPSL